MSAWTPAARRLGIWSAFGVTLIGAAYVVTGLLWIASRAEGSPGPFEPGEPFRAVLEFLILLSAPMLVVMAAAVHAYAPPERKTGALAGLAFMTGCAVLTCGMHILQLAVARRLPADAVIELAVLRVYPWPSMSLAIDFLAWDLFLGLALLFAAPAFAGGRLQTAVRAAMTLGGALCVFGFLGPLLGVMRLQLLAIGGYAFVLPIACALLAILFRRSAPAGTASSRSG